jgi:hypothetical protein
VDHQMSNERPHPVNDTKYQEFLTNLFEVRSSQKKPNNGKTLIEWEQDHYRLNSSFRYGRPVRGLSLKQVIQSASLRPTANDRHEKLLRTIQRTPEVMVKITGGGKNTGSIQAHFAYITRTDHNATRSGKEPVEFEDEHGNVYKGSEDVKDVMEAWRNGKIGIPRQGERRQEAFNIILSMPPGTNREGVKKAARAFAQEQFKNHQYIFAEHTDEKHPHVHLCVKATNFEGRRLNPRKKDLREWRESFAAHLRAQGIAANATQRQTRGVTQKAQKQSIRHIDARRAGQGDTLSNVTTKQMEDVAKALAGQKHENPAASAIKKNRQNTIHTYGQIARLLAQAEDSKAQKAALEVMKFVQTMPPMKTRHEESVDAARRTTGGGISQGGAGKGRAEEQKKNATPDKTHEPGNEK